jgi:hypothetical protein
MGFLPLTRRPASGVKVVTSNNAGLLSTRYVRIQKPSDLGRLTYKTVDKFAQYGAIF